MTRVDLIRSLVTQAVVLCIIIGVVVLLSGCGALCGYHYPGCTPLDKQDRTWEGISETMKRKHI